MLSDEEDSRFTKVENQDILSFALKRNCSLMKFRLTRNAIRLSFLIQLKFSWKNQISPAWRLFRKEEIDRFLLLCTLNQTGSLPVTPITKGEYK